MHSTRELLDQVVADLDRVLSGDGLAELSDGERILVLTTAGAAFRRVEAVVVETLANADSADFPHSAGCRSENELVERAALVDTQGASRICRAARLVRRDQGLTSGERLPARWPAMRDALLDGVIGVAGLLSATWPIEKISHRVGRAGILAAALCLAAEARGCTVEDLCAAAPAEGDPGDSGSVRLPSGPGVTPDDLARAAHEFASRLDQDGAIPGDDGEAHAKIRRRLTLGRTRDGLRTLRAELLPDVAAQLELILDAILNPRGDGAPLPGVAFRPSEGSSDGAAKSDAEADDRTAAQKRHDAFAAALGIAARHRDMPTVAGASPTLVVTVDAADLTRAGDGVTPETAGDARGSAGHARGLAWAGPDSPLPALAAVHIACGGVIQRVLFDRGRIIGISSTDRVFTVHQRRAIIARDKECLIPGCHVPASWCEIHHVIEHSRGGPTHTDNGVPLCWWHHRTLDTSGWEVRMDGGTPQARGPSWWDPDRRWRTPSLSRRSRSSPSRHQAA